ncbi:glycosyltransferase family 2 protein [Luteimonas sp. XNQY3]|nr:glycosyltransferase family A protein [Luteimonas sp. XNQY3]MCD9005784.1 glycosyltransferase family 2 protein [Luteimonas sp. XNQY3]
MSGVPFHFDHAYVVPAYGDSPHLDACLASLVAQHLASPIIVSASVPGARLEETATRYGARYLLHGPNRSIGHDWNTAVDAAGTEWVTIAHQDDVYLPGFGQAVASAVRESPDALLISTDYAELLGDLVRNGTPLLRIKRTLIELAYLGRREISGRGARRRLLRFGCPISCPTVTFSRQRSGLHFDEHMRTNLDWDAWVRLTELQGTFVHLRRPLVQHRIHPDSETSVGVRSGIRAREDLEMFSRFWPGPVARLIALAYGASYHAPLPGSRT